MSGEKGQEKCSQTGINILDTSLAKCGVASSYPKTTWENTDFSCPNCNRQWFPDGSSDKKGLKLFMEGLSILSKRDKNAPSRIQLEMNAPK